jgi:Ca2+-binding RTX toxin-like protein
VATDTGADNISAGGGNDTITFGGDNEFNVLDTVDGGDGKDTLTHNEDTIVSSQLGGLSNVEVLKSAVASTVTLNSDVGPTEFNLANAATDTISFNDDYSQATTVNLYGDAASADTITNNSDIALTVIGLTTDFAADLTTDSPLTITGSATATDSLVIYSAGNGNIDANGTATITNIDNVSFNSTVGVTGSYSVATSFDFGAYATPLVVTNNLGALDGALTTDFSGGVTLGTLNYTGGVGVDIVTGSTLNDTITTGAGNDTVTSTSGTNTIDTGDGVDIVNMGSGVDIIDTGAGNDTIVADATDLKANDVVIGGAGTDTLTYAATSIADESVFGGLEGVEVIKGLAGNTAAMALTMNANMGPKIIDASDDANLTLTLKAGVTDDITVKLGADIGSNDDNVVNGGVGMANTTLTVTATDADSLDSTTNITGGTGTDTITLTVVGGGAADITGSTGIDVMNIIDFTTGEDVTLAAGANGNTPLTINATTQDAGETLNLNATAATVTVTVNAGAGADTLAGGGGGDVIYGNAGADQIDGQGNSAVTGADAIYGGAGNDIITVSTGESEFSNSSTTALVTDTIDGGAGTDTLVFGDAAASLSKAELTNITNIEKLTLYTGTSITLSDAFLTNNPGISITLVAGTISAGAGTTADPIITLPLNYIAGDGNIKVTGGTADDTFGTSSAALINVSDTIDGGAGTDSINVYNDSAFGSAATRGTGDAVTLALDIYHTNVENIVIVDSADDDDAGDVTVNIALAYTGTALTIDASSLDQNSLGTEAEILTVAQNTSDTAALTVTGGTGGDIITSGAAADHLTGGVGADTFVSSGGNDSIYGGAGNDIINAGAGRDYIEAGDGNDAITVTADSDFEVSGGTETIDGGTGVDTLTFKSNANHDISSAELGNVKNIEVINIDDDAVEKSTVIGLSDTVLANANGSITILGNAHAHADSDHKIDGAAVGTGSIRFIPKGDTTAKNDTFIGGAGDDTLQIGFNSATSPGATGVAVELEAADVFTGNGGTDVIEYFNVGDNLAASPTAGTGDITAIIDFDTITGVEKIVVMDPDGPVLGTTADPIKTTIAALSATTTKMPATFEYDGSIVTDIIDTQDFNYNNTTSADNDALTTDFTITTGAANDSVGGSGGDDLITTGAGADNVFGGGRSDTIDGGSGNDNLYGGDETALTGGGDSILGGTGDDTIDGDGGADTILGGDGADIITGGTGADIMTGGSGADVFTLSGSSESGGASIDTITDFVSGSDSVRITYTAAQMTATSAEFAATDLGDVSTFAEVEAILSGKVGEAVYVKDTGQVVIDLNGDANINSNDIRFNLEGSTGYDNADVVYTIGLDTGSDRTYTLSDGADIVTGTTDVKIDTINALGGNDNIASGSGADIIDGGAGNDTIDGAVGVDVITGGAGNDTISLTDDEADTWTASGVTATAPYSGINTGSDIVAVGGGGGAAHGQFDLDPLTSVTAGSTGTAGWLSLESTIATDVLTVNTDATLGVIMTNKMIAIDDNDLTPTAAELAGKIETTTNTDDEFLDIGDNGAGIIIHGSTENTPNAKLTIWWVDSALDGDGTDVTTADVQLLVTTSVNVDLDLFTNAQFLV